MQTKLSFALSLVMKETGFSTRKWPFCQVLVSNIKFGSKCKVAL